MKQTIIYPAIVENIHNMMYRTGKYQGQPVRKSGIYKIMVQHGFIDELGQPLSESIDSKTILRTIRSELKLKCYEDGFYRCMDVASSKELETSKLIYYGIKYLGSGYVFNPLKLEHTFNSFDLVLMAIDTITPRKLMQIFPIDKKYDGHKWESKDYYTTMDVMREHGMDRQIGTAEGQAFDFLWDYMNHDVMMFVVRFMSVLSDMSQLKGNGDPTVKFFESQGIEVKHRADFE
ncbi:hypothetical protein FC26_GL002010 [Paucilactobacillus vaccinostercus DSM 20634]|uniref:Uncharacterized protein n=1 Tax=Paucilactobacillus vaccinostercus DSM 20634 TaxID=1423813 RepID=A0A0R2A6Z0_9LACO|nr:hypothetical protein [Paucilactobacillus vaccinostercus]KRM62437.1 hypothetical protein FC26_GL002010 [Paucilactobacillus vaccinostercus DSM 20634]